MLQSAMLVTDRSLMQEVVYSFERAKNVGVLKPVGNIGHRPASSPVFILQEKI